MAAFSGGGGVASEGRPQAIYRTFFKKYAELFAGWRPTAPAAILYAYWGPNPLSAYHGNHPPTIHQRLITSHRPYVALVDAWLPDRAKELADFGVLYLESPAYEMSPQQLQALGDYAQRGRIVLGDRAGDDQRAADHRVAGKRTSYDLGPKAADALDDGRRPDSRSSAESSFCHLPKSRSPDGPRGQLQRLPAWTGKRKCWK